jgi:TolA-binding protein
VKSDESLVSKEIEYIKEPIYSLNAYNEPIQKSVSSLFWIGSSVKKIGLCMRFKGWILFLFGPLLGSAEGDQEALFLRRIADFWQEGEYQIAKSQMEEFIVEYPKSPFSDALCAALGDLFLREKNYTQALNYYNQVQSAEFVQKVFLNRMQCLYEMQWYATLADECEAFLQKEPNLHVTYFLAISLYHQCINASKETETLHQLAERAKPYFETLFQSEFSNEIAQGYAHLCCILKDYPKATEIYLQLAKNPGLEEEMLFQVALIQAEYNKELALDTFAQIANLKRKRAKEATYNKMVIAFEMGRYEEVVKEEYLSEVPLEKVGTARLFVGRSFLQLKNYERAMQELKAYIDTAPPSETLYAALISLLDASYQGNDLTSLDEAIEKLNKNYPTHPELPKAYFSRVQLLKKSERLVEAKEQLESLLTQFPNFTQKPQATFELCHLEYKEKQWEKCYQKSLQFIAEFPEHELAPFVWRYAVSSSIEIAAVQPLHKEKLLVDLKSFLKLPLSEKEKKDWELLLAKTHYEMHHYEEATHLLQNQQTPNAKLLLSLCIRDQSKDPQAFCELAEEALAEGANLVDLGQIHVSLYNAYLELSQFEKAAQHLYEAFLGKATIKTANLIWLADHYSNLLKEKEENFVLAARIASILDFCKAALQDEEHLCKLGRAYLILGRFDDAVALLTPLSSASNEASLLLAQTLLKQGLAQQAIELFDAIVVSCGTGRSPISALATLEGARLKLTQENCDQEQIAHQLKNLILQKNMEGEPTYLEAALDYVDLMAKGNPEQKLALLQQAKSDFLEKEDLLSKDYHAARALSPRKDHIYQGYIKLMDAEILAAQAKIDLQNQEALKTKARELLAQLTENPMVSTLNERVRKLLADES